MTIGDLIDKLRSEPNMDDDTLVCVSDSSFEEVISNSDVSAFSPEVHFGKDEGGNLCVITFGTQIMG